MNIFQHLFLALVAFMAVNIGLYAQSDTLLLNDGRVLVGSYRVSFTHSNVENKVQSNQAFSADIVNSLSTSKKYYRSINVVVDSVSYYYMAERLEEGEVDLYGLDFPAGHFKEHSVPQSFFYLEKEGGINRVNKASVEAFVTAYFAGECYDALPVGKLTYNKRSLSKFVEAYNRCRNPNAPQRVRVPWFTQPSLSAFGGYGKFKHYSQLNSLKGIHLSDNAYHVGMGLNYVFLKKINLGAELIYDWHEVGAPISNTPHNYGPSYQNASFKTYRLNLMVSFPFKFNNLTMEPIVGFGAGSIYEIRSFRLKSEPTITIHSPSSPPKFYLLDKTILNFNAYAKLSYPLGSRLSVFARVGFTWIIGSPVYNSKGYIMDGFPMALGASYNLKN